MVQCSGRRPFLDGQRQKAHRRRCASLQGLPQRQHHGSHRPHGICLRYARPKDESLRKGARGQHRHHRALCGVSESRRRGIHGHRRMLPVLPEAVRCRLLPSDLLPEEQGSRGRVHPAAEKRRASHGRTSRPDAVQQTDRRIQKREE